MTWRTPLIATALIAAVIFVRHSNQKLKVLGTQTLISPLVTDTVTPTIATASAAPQDTPTATPTARPTKKPTPKPTPTPKPQPQYSSQQIYEFTDKYGILYAVDPNVIRHLALCESGFNPNAKNGPYVGLFQFDIRTWQTYRQLFGLDADADLRYNAEEAVKTTARMLFLGKSALWPNCYPK